MGNGSFTYGLVTYFSLRYESPSSPHVMSVFIPEAVKQHLFLLDRYQIQGADEDGGEKKKEYADRYQAQGQAERIQNGVHGEANPAIGPDCHDLVTFPYLREAE